MTTDETNQQSPFTRPGFLVAALLIAIIVIAGIVLGIRSMTREPTPEVAPATDAATPSGLPLPTPTESSDESVCGLGGEVLAGTVTIAPAAEWQYQGTISYPLSEEFGPAEVSEEGVRSCFQRSPEGALFAAANGAVQASDAQTVGAWLDYFLAEGPNRDEFLESSPGGGDTNGIRLRVAGFKVLNYDGDKATIDVGLSGSVEGQPSYLSGIFHLTWEDGDWKLDVQDPLSPVDYATIPDLSGYIAWGE